MEERIAMILQGVARNSGGGLGGERPAEWKGSQGL